jgi:hypothetical protein
MCELFLDRADCNEELITAFEKLAASLEFKRSSATGFGEASKSSGTIGNDAFSTKLGEISVEVAEVFEDAVEYHEHYADYGATVMEAAIPQDSVV